MLRGTLGILLAAGPAWAGSAQGIGVQPIPEPAGIAALAVGLGALLWRRRR